LRCRVESLEKILMLKVMEGVVVNKSFDRPLRGEVVSDLFEDVLNREGFCAARWGVTAHAVMRRKHSETLRPWKHVP